MRTFGRIATVVVVATFALAAPASAQRRDASAVAVEKNFHALFDVGNYAAALVEAQKLAPMIAAQSGTQSINYGVALIYLAECYLNLQRYGEAEPYYKKAIDIVDAVQPPHRTNAIALRGELGAAYQGQGRLVEAEALLRQALTMAEQTPNLPAKTMGDVLNNLGLVLAAQGRYRDAELVQRRQLALVQTTPATANRDVASAMHNLGFNLARQGRYAEAEVLIKRALAMYEQVLGPNQIEVAASLQDLGTLFHDDKSRYEEAIALYQRAISIEQATLGANSSALATTVANLATAYQSLGRFADAEKLQLQSLAMREKLLGPDHQDVALGLRSLGSLYTEQGRLDDAERTLLRSVATWERVTGARNPDLAYPLQSLGIVYQRKLKYVEAEDAFKRALALMQSAFGPNHPVVASFLNNLSALAGVRDLTTDALAYSRNAVALLITDTALAVAAGQTQTGGSFEVDDQQDIFCRYVDNLAVAAHKGIVPHADAGREAFVAAQSACHSSKAATALAQMGLRFAPGDDALAALVRESQDLSAAWTDKDAALTAARSVPGGQQDRAAINRLQADVSSVETRLVSVTARLRQQFPDYAALASPKALKIDEVQKLLGADEALVYFLLGDTAPSYVFGATREGFEWQTIALGGHELSAKVAAFRQGLDVDMVANQDTLDAIQKKRVLFDLGTANELYASLLGPVESLINGKRHLLVVPTASLTALPFHLLVTEKPVVPTDIDSLARYRDAAWLIKRQAVSVLPSVASLSALRAFAHNQHGTKPMIGFGDPVFSAQDGDGGQRGAKARQVTTRSFGDFWQGAGVDRTKLGQALPRLADTADELKAVAQSLGAGPGDIYLRQAASETTVKHTNLSDYRVVYFATHGLVAGDVKGLAEPSLALSIPVQPTDIDDGLLTASEVAQLKLNADWVVLSACNTIAGDKPGAEALSGLARAFFYAGGRALLVSHWSVASDAATRLTTSTFDILKSDPSLGRAEALRRAMLSYLNDASDPRSAYPAFWGPFSIIGEGAAR